MDASAAASAAAPTVATVTGSGVFLIASAREAAGAPASTAGAMMVIPPNGTRGTTEAQGGVFPMPPVDWTTARHDQPPETATTQRLRY